MRFLSSFGWASSLALLSTFATAPRTARAAVTCSGTQTQVIDGVWSVADATLQDRTPIASGGPNIIMNGDFTFAASSNPNLTNVDETNLNKYVYNWINDEPPADFILMPIQNWETGGGGSRTYGRWGVYFQDIYPMTRVDDTGAGPSMVYFGNSDGTYSGITQVEAQAMFNADGVGANANLVLEPPVDYGTPETPVQLNQTVATTPGKLYRLQFMQGAEEMYWITPPIPDGVFAVDITGYERLYLLAHQEANYRTIDFVAKEANTNIKFMSWAHINILGTPGGPVAGATELALDDVILTECIGGPPGPTPGGGCKGSLAIATTSPSGKVTPFRTFGYSAMLTNPRKPSVRELQGTNFGAQNMKMGYPFINASFSMAIPTGVTVRSAGSSPKLATVPVIDTAAGQVAWFLGNIQAGRKVKVALKLAATNCTTPAALALDGKFSYFDAAGAKTVDACLKKPLYVWEKGCPAIPKSVKTPGTHNRHNKPIYACTCSACDCDMKGCYCPKAGCNCTTV